MSSLPPGIDLCSVPAGMPPPGETSNSLSLAPTMIAVGTIVTLWALLFVVIRIWENRQKLLVADYMVIFAIIWDISFTSLILSQSRTARHQWNILYTGLLVGPYIPESGLPYLSALWVHRSLQSCYSSYVSANLFGLKADAHCCLDQIGLRLHYIYPKHPYCHNLPSVTLWPKLEGCSRN
ncbi:hypothetical protein F5Y03DRAFT_119840 [Xylaria venustula]|nr:hypothetical protein F5Y03DRAFT_119840 [Xylaria venustula]